MNTISSSILALGVFAAISWSEPATEQASEPDVLLSIVDDQAVTAAAKDQKEKDPPKKQRGKFTIGKETTYVTGPLDNDGYVDYAAALNERLGKGVTPANNANVLLWKALGPHPEGATMPAEFFKLLGIEAPPENGEYFIDLSRYMKEQLKIDAIEEVWQIQDQLSRATQRAWTPKEYPKLDSWLKAKNSCNE
jgi:hypothetical protein